MKLKLWIGAAGIAIVVALGMARADLSATVRGIAYSAAGGFQTNAPDTGVARAAGWNGTSAGSPARVSHATLVARWRRLNL